MMPVGRSAALLLALAVVLALFLVPEAHAQQVALPAVSFQSVEPSNSVYEGEEVTFTLHRTGDVSQPLTVRVRTFEPFHPDAPSTSPEGNPTNTLHQVIFAAGDATATLKVTADYDLEDETAADTDRLEAAIAPESDAPYTTASPSQFQINITDASRSVSISTEAETVREGEAATFTLTRTGPLATALTVRVSSIELFHPEREGELALNPSYQRHDVTFLAGSATSTLEVTADFDGVPEKGDLLNVILSPQDGSPWHRAGAFQQVIHIVDVTRTVTVATSQTTVAEGETATFTLTRDGPPTEELGVNIAVSDPGAFLRGNHSQSPPTVPTGVTFEAGSATATVELAVIDDLRDVPNNTLTVTVEQGHAYTPGTGSNGSASVTVEDNDIAAELEVSVDKTSIEEGETAVVTIRRVGNGNTPIEIPIRMGFEGNLSTDWTSLNDDENAVSFEITPEDNDLDEADRTYEFFVMSYPLGWPLAVRDQYWTLSGSGSVNITVTDNDLPMVWVEAVSESRREGEFVRFRLRREGVTTDSLSVRVEYSQVTNVRDGLPGRVRTSIAAGQDSRTLNHLAARDGVDEPEGSLTISLVPDDSVYRVDSSRASASTRIIDVDPLPMLEIADVSGPEDVGFMVFTVSLADGAVSGKAVSGDISVSADGTATGGFSREGDFDFAEGIFTIEPGATSITHRVRINDDDLAEPDETFTVVISEITNAALPDGQTTLTATGTIEDDEPHVTIRAVNAVVTEGEPAGFLLTRIGGDTTGELTVHLRALSSYDPGLANRPQAVTFAAGEEETTWEHATVDDDADTANGLVFVSLLVPGPDDPPAAYHAATSPAFVTVEDNDLPTVTITADHGSRTEGEDATFTVTRAGLLTDSLIVNVSVTGGDDFVSGTRPTSVTLAAGDATATLTVTTTNDDPVDSPDGLTAAITTSASYDVGDPGSAELTLFDSAGAYPAVSIRANNAFVDEGDDVVFTLTRSAYGADESLTVRVQVVETRWYDRDADTDPSTPTSYGLARLIVTDLDLEFEAGSRSATVLRPTVNETLNDGNSNLKATIRSGPYLVPQGQGSAQTWVRDDDIPTVTIESVEVQLPEGESADRYFLGEHDVRSLPVLETGFSERVENTNELHGTVLSRTGDTTRHLGVIVNGYGFNRHPERIQLESGALLIDGVPLHSHYYGELEIDEGSEGDFVHRLRPILFSGILAGDVSTVYTRRPHTVDPLGGFVYYEVSPFYCETVPGDCGLRPQYRIGTPSSTTYRILNDAQGVRVEASQSSVTEGDSITFTLHRYGSTFNTRTRPLTVQVQVTQNGQFISGATPTTVTFADGGNVPDSSGNPPEGELTATVTVQTTNDQTDEADGTITFTILPPTADATADNFTVYEPEPDQRGIWSSVATVQVIDDDEVGFSIADASADEADGAIEFTVTIPETALATSVDWATADDATGGETATEDEDYTAASGSLTFAPGETSKTFTVTVVDDDLKEEDETFTVVLSNPVNAALTDSTATGTINNDDLPQLVIINVGEGMADGVIEGEAVVFRLHRITGTPTDQYVGIERGRLEVALDVGQEGDVIAGEPPLTAVIEAGEFETTVTVPTDDDRIFEETGGVSLHIKSIANSLYSNGEPVTVDVYDNDMPVSVSGPGPVDEDAGTISFTVRLDAPAVLPVSVAVATVDGNATSHGVVTPTDLGKDFEARSETLTFAEEEQEKQFTVTIVDDLFDEVGTEEFTVVLTAPSNGRIRDGVAEGRINDNEESLFVHLSPPVIQNIAEDTETPVAFRVDLRHHLTLSSEREIEIGWEVTPLRATAGEDYVETGGALVIPPGHTSGQFEINLIDDDLFEQQNEDFSVALTASSNASLISTARHPRIRIRDDDVLAIAIFADAEMVGEGLNAGFYVQLAGPAATDDVSITYEYSGTATVGEDFTAPETLELTIPVGKREVSFSFQTLTDIVEDPGETLTVTLTEAESSGRNVVSKRDSVTVTILDQGATWVSVEPATATEGDGMEFLVKLSQKVDEEVQVEWTTASYEGDPFPDGAAISETDYEAGNYTVEIAPGDTIGSFTVSTLEDNLFEGTELFLVRLIGASRVPQEGTAVPVALGSATALGRILDDDELPAGIDLTVVPNEVAEDGGETELTVTATLKGSSTLTVAAPVSLRFGGEDAILGEDYTGETSLLTIPAGESTATGKVMVTPVNDGIAEGAETFRIEGESGNLEATPALVTITDDDDPADGVTLTVTPSSVGEDAGATTLVVRAVLTGGAPVDTDITLDLSVEGASLPIFDENGDSTGETTAAASAGDDFSASPAPGVLTIVAGQTEGVAELVLTPDDDEVAEGDETARVVGSAQGLTVVPAPLTIVDNDREPTGIELLVDPAEVDEQEGIIDLDVTAKLTGGGARSTDTLVSLNLHDLTATAGEDYKAPATAVTLTIPAGQTSGADKLSLTLFDDNLYEGEELFAVRGANSDPGLPVTGFQVSIADDDAEPTVVALTLSKDRIPEGAGPQALQVTATLQGNVARTAATSLTLTVAAGTASAGDFSALPAELQILAGQLGGSGTLLLSPMDDSINEPDETLEVKGTASEPGLTVSARQVIITDDDEVGVAISPNPLPVTEGDSAGAEYTVALTSQPEGDVTVTITGHADTDLTLDKTTLTFTTGTWNTEQTVTVKATEDHDAVTDADVTLTHAITSDDDSDYNALADLELTVTIAENDTAGVTIHPTTLPVTEGDATGNTYTVVLTSQPTADVTVTVSGHANTAITLSGTTLSADNELTFTTEDWSDAQTVTVTAGAVTADTVVTLSHAVTGGDYGSVTAEDVIVTVANLVQVISIVAAKSPIAEGTDANAQFTLTRDGPTSEALTVDVTVTQEGDFIQGTAPAQVAFDANNATTTLDVPIDDDEVKEFDGGTITVTLDATSDYGVSATAGSASVRVLDDEALVRVSWMDTEVTVAEDAGTVQLTAVVETALGGSPVAIPGQTEWLTAITVAARNPDTAASGTDFKPVSEEVGVAESDYALESGRYVARVAVPVTIINDRIDEDDELFWVDLDSGSLMSEILDVSDLGPVAKAKVTITDDDVAVWAIDLSTSTIGEAGGTATVTVSTGEVSFEEQRAISLAFAGTATEDDYTVSSGGTDLSSPYSLTLAVGETSVEATVTATDDARDEDDETVLVSASHENGSIGAQQKVTITDDDTAGVSIEPTALTVMEGQSNAYEVVLDTDPSAEVTVTISGHADTALSLSTSTLTFTSQDWDSPQEVTLTAGDVAADTDVSLAHAVAGGDYASVTADDMVATILDFPKDQAIIQVGVTVSPLGLTVPEGDSNTYDVVLGHQPTGDVTIAITVEDAANNDVSTDEASLVFTTVDWNQAQTVTVRAAEDYDALQDPVVSITHTPSGANYEEVTVPGVQVTITENDEVGVTISATSLTVTEGDATGKGYTVKLDSEPEGDVTVTISGHAGTDLTLDKTTLTFTTGTWNTTQTVTVTAVEDQDAVTDADVTLTHVITSDDDTAYDALADKSVTVSITEKHAVGVTISATSLTVDEGDATGKGYTVRLNAQPSDEVTINITGGGDVSVDPTTLTFTTGDWNTTQTVTVTAAHDSDGTNDTQAISHAVDAGNSADEYDGVSIEDVTVTVTDDDGLVTISADTTPVTEGASAEFTLTRQGNTSASLTVTVAVSQQGEYISGTAPTSAVFGAGDATASLSVATVADYVDEANGSVTATLQTGAGYVVGTSGSATVIVEDDDDVGVTLSATSLTVTEGDATGKGYTVRLNTQPSDEVTINITAGGDVSVDPTTLTFTTGDWNTAQTVTVTALEDQDAVTDADVTLTHAITSDDDTAYDALADKSVTVSITEKHAVGVTISATSLTVDEGDATGKGYTVRLNAQPSDEVTINITGGGDVSVDPTTLTFTTGDWNTTQTVTVTAAHDSDGTNDTQAISHAVDAGNSADEYDGVSIEDVTVTVTDDDGLVTISADTTPVTEGASAEFTLTRQGNTSASLTVTVAVSQQGEYISGAAPTSAVFGAGNTTASLSVATVADYVDEADGSVTAALQSGGGYVVGTPGSATVIVEDDDDVGVTISATSLTVTEGDATGKGYTVRLNTQPSDEVTINITAGGDVSVDPTTLTFTTGDWNTAQTVTVTALEDQDAVTDADVTLTHAITSEDDTAYDALADKSVTVSITEKHAVGVTISATSLTVDEGDATGKGYTVRLNAQPSDEVTINITGGGDVSVDPTTLTFTTGDWNTTQTVTVTAAHDSDGTNDTQAISHAVDAGNSADEYDGVSIEDVTVTVTDDDGLVTISADTTPVTEGASAEFTLTRQGNTSASLTVTVAVSQQGEYISGAAPTSAVFGAGNTTASLSVATVADYVDEADGSVTAALQSGGGYVVGTPGSATVIVEDDDDVGVTISATSLTVTEGDATGKGYTVKLDSEPEGDVTVTITGHADTDLTLDKTALTFTTGTWNTTQTVTVTALEDQDAVTDADVILTHAITSDDDSAYNALADKSVTVSITEKHAVGVTISATSLTVDEGDATGKGYTVRLNTQPSDEVTINITAGGDVSVDPTTLTFTTGDWNTTQTVTVTAAHDSDGTNDTQAISHAVDAGNSADEYDGVSIEDVTVTVTDDDGLVTISADTTPVTEGASAEFTLTRQGNTSASLTVTVAVSQQGEYISGTAPTSAVFGAGDATTALSVATVADYVDEADGSVTAALQSGAGYLVGTPGSATVIVEDDDAVGVTLSTTSLTVDEGDATGKSYTVKLDSQPAGDVTVTITGHAGTDLTLDKTALTFTTGTWNTTQTVTVTAVEDQDAVTDADVTLTHAITSEDDTAYNALADQSVTVSITEKHAVGVTISTTSLTVDEGDATGKGYTVRLNTQPSDEVTINITAGGDVSVDPTTLTFTTGDWNTTQTVTVTAAHDSDGTNDTQAISHAVDAGNSADEYDGVSIEDVTVTVTDDDGLVTISADTTPVTEGASAEFTLTRQGNTSASLTVTVAVSQQGEYISGTAPTSAVFGAGDATTALSVATVADYVDEADGSVTAALQSGAGYLVGTPGSATVIVEDDDAVGVTLSTTSLTVDEGDATGKSYTVKLDSQPAGDVTVTITGHAGTDLTLDKTALTFTTGTWNTTQTVTVTAVEDQDAVTDADVTLTHAITSEDDTAYNALADQSVTVSITEKHAVGVTISTTSLTVTEGDATGKSYTVKLDSEPEGDVTVTISGHADTDLTLDKTTLTFTTGTWNTAQTVTVTAVEDQDAVTDADVTLTHVITSDDDSDYDALADQSVTVSITDADGLVTISADTTPVTEGASAEFTLTRQGNTSGELTVTVAVSQQGEYISGTAPTSAVFGAGDATTALSVATVADNVDETNGSVTAALQSGAGYLVGTPGSATVIVEDDDAVGVTISTTSLTVTEGDATGKGYTVKLDSEPEGDVTVTITGHADTDLTLDKTALTFATGTWNTAQTVTVTAVEDQDAVTDADVTLTHAITSEDDTAYNALADQSVTVSITEKHAVGVTISTTSLTVTEGDATGKSYTVKLDSQPEGDVTVTITGHAGTDLTLDKTTLTFTTGTWNTAQTVTVTAVEDQDAVTDADVTLTHAITSDDDSAYNALADKSVTVSITEKHAVGVTISATSLTVTEGDATGKGYTVKLDSQPEGDVTVTITGHAGTDLTLDKTALTFTTGDWNTTQTVTVTALEDQDAVTDADVTLTHAITSDDDSAYNALADKSVTVSITEKHAVGVTLSTTALTVDEGDATGKSYTVKLDSEPEGDVTVTITGHADTDLTLDKTTLTFTTGTWNTAQTVTVTAVEDQDAVTDADVTLTHVITSDDDSDYNALADQSVTVSITEKHGLVTISADTTPVTEGVSAEFTLTRQGNTSASLTVTVAVSQQGEYISGTAPTSAVFGAGDATTALSVATVADNVDEADGSVTATLQSGAGYVVGTPGSATVIVEDDDETEERQVIADTDCGTAIWCGTLKLAERPPGEHGYPTYDYHPRNPGSSLSDDRFEYMGTDYTFIHMLIIPYPEELFYGAPYSVPGQSRFYVDMGAGGEDWSTAHGAIPEEHYLDWTLYFGDLELRFRDAEFYHGQTFMWMSAEWSVFDNAESSGAGYQLRLEANVPEPSGPDTTPPNLVDATLWSKTLTITYDEELQDDPTPSSKLFYVTLNAIHGDPVPLAGVSVNGTDIVLTTEQPIPWDSVVCLYVLDMPTTRHAPVRDLAGNRAPPTECHNVTNNWPSPPRFLELASHGSDQLRATWVRPAYSRGSLFDGYRIEWRPAAGSWDTPADVSEATVTGYSYDIGGLSSGVTYVVRVTGLYPGGDGPPSDEATYTTP